MAGMSGRFFENMILGSWWCFKFSVWIGGGREEVPEASFVFLFQPLLGQHSSLLLTLFMSK